MELKIRDIYGNNYSHSIGEYESCSLIPLDDQPNYHKLVFSFPIEPNDISQFNDLFELDQDLIEFIQIKDTFCNFFFVNPSMYTIYLTYDTHSQVYLVKIKTGV